MAKTYKFEIYESQSHESPREFDNVGTMACREYRRYDLGDKNGLEDLMNAIKESGVEMDEADWELSEQYTEHDVSFWAEMFKKYNLGVIQPLYLYDHSGVTMSTTPFADKWDSSSAGFIFATNQKIQEMGWNLEDYKALYQEELSKNGIMIETMDDIAEVVLAGEVKTYDQYLTGEIYGFSYEVFDDDGEEIIGEEDACSGFYGDDLEENGIFENIPDELVNALKEKGLTKAYDFTYNEVISITIGELSYQIPAYAKEAVIDRLVENDISSIKESLSHGDTEFLSNVLAGNGFKPYSQLTNNQLVEEFRSALEENIKEFVDSLPKPADEITTFNDAERLKKLNATHQV